MTCEIQAEDISEYHKQNIIKNIHKIEISGNMNEDDNIKGINQKIDVPECHIQNIIIKEIHIINISK